MTSRPHGTGGDGGFTLVETLIALAVMAILIPALGLVLTTMLGQTKGTQARMELSSDAQLAGAYFADDVASTGVRDTSGNPVQSVELNAAPTGGLYPCGPATLPNASVRLAWDELTDGSTEVKTRVVVSYVVVASGSTRELRRVECRGGTTTANDVVANNVSAATAPALSCSTACDGASPPKRASLALTLAHPDNPTPLAVTLTGQRRQT